MSKLLKPVVAVVALIGVAAAVLFGAAQAPGSLGNWAGSLLAGLNPIQSDRTDRTGPSVEVRLTELSEFKAASGYYETVVDIEDDTSFVPDFISGQRVLYVGKGRVEATVDFSELDERRIETSGDGTAVKVTLPAPTASDPVLDVEASEFALNDQGLIDRFRGSEIEQDAQVKAVEQMATAAEGEGNLLGLAEESTTDMLSSLLGSLGYTDVEVVFEDA